MNCDKIGKLILNIRKEKNMTQKELADMMNLSDRTISKWERGLGAPDVSLLSELSKILGVNIEKILTGDLEPNNKDGGNMNKVKIYVCPNCENVLFSTGDADVSCCGRKLAKLSVKATSKDQDHEMTVSEIEDDYYITIDHEMTKKHYIAFVAFVGPDRILIVKLYPEQSAQIRFPKMYGSKIYAYCSEHGLWEERV